ncbi:hypothetical protein [Clostridium beijerinckii]|uniref:hypothetical protein n=1 Tax=Clostridium beijerinckii TaxID=1520 RepID=UPI00098C5E8A|nr:hypothetical protein [Clostridium beijerinckii]MBA8937771.1 glucan-binding YG repeat protein [Clostridium beijerinckii]NRU41613.1 glucan-binding YG repeat protein [Clostridium beijerinckii]NRU41672.1 glucan-binding YG repeat protein [Clostridium beijerinckii]NSB00843.1 glucan-binding YG repeat protein [Clostridium beijerinckii]OOM52613.1 autolysin [Clostridium beijerinckii]
MNKKIIKMFMGVLLIANILVPGYALDKSKNNIDQLQIDKFTGWYFDKEKGVNEYYKDGNIISNGWFQINEKWYYFKTDGAMATGWLNLNNNWYYLNKNGTLQTGWLQDSVGKWYYLNSDGTMMHDATTPDGYKIGSDGVWIK